MPKVGQRGQACAGTVRFPTLGVTVPSQRAIRNDFLASATARGGYSFADRWLVFVRVGAAWTNEKIDDSFKGPADGLAVDPTTKHDPDGRHGVQWAFAPHLSASIECNYYDFGNSSPLLTDNVGTRVTIVSLKDAIHAVTAGVNYHLSVDHGSCERC